MVAGTTPNAARKKARDHASKLLDAEDADRRRREAERRKRITDNVAEIAGNDAEISQLTAKVEDLRADTAQRLAAIVADGVTEAQVAAMTEREPREVKTAVRAMAAQQPRAARRPAATPGSAAEPATT